MFVPENIFPLRPPLPLPEGVSENELFNWLKNVRVIDAPTEILNYCIQDFRRFVYTYGLVKEASKEMQVEKGYCLELGANPYFTTMILKEFTSYELVLANYFNEGFSLGKHSQQVNLLDFNPKGQDQARKMCLVLDYYHFNVENDTFPFSENSFDIVLFCEIIEHLLIDPVKVLREIRRILKSGGQLILTTPNVSRLENVARMISGVNIYDPYSGYGPYGRHNREYNKHELYLLMNYMGFSIQELFSADVHENIASHYYDLSDLYDRLKFREADLGQYIFLRAVKDGFGQGKKPTWLYRSFPLDELDA